MGTIVAAALPVLPGHSGRLRGFADEVARHQDEYDRLNREGTFVRHTVSLQESLAGDLAIHVFEVEDPSGSARRSSIRPTTPGGWTTRGTPPASMVFDWQERGG